MKTRLALAFALLLIALTACDSGDAELSTSSTIITGGTNAPETSTTSSTTIAGESPGTTLQGQSVTEYTVVQRIPNENGEEVHVVLPPGAYTDVDLEIFIVDLLDSDPTIYGAEVFDDEDAAAAFLVASGARTEEQNALLERHHLVSLIGRERIEFRGPFAEFPGTAIGS